MKTVLTYLVGYPHVKKTLICNSVLKDDVWYNIILERPPEESDESDTYEFWEVAQLVGRGN